MKISRADVPEHVGGISPPVNQRLISSTICLCESFCLSLVAEMLRKFIVFLSQNDRSIQDRQQVVEHLFSLIGP